LVVALALGILLLFPSVSSAQYPGARTDTELRYGVGSPERETLAVLPVMNSRVLVRSNIGAQKSNADGEEEYQLALSLDVSSYGWRSLEHLIVERLLEVPIYRLIERSDWERLLEEQNLQASGLIDEAHAVELGRLLGADNILQPSVLMIERKIEGDPGNESFHSEVVRRSKAIRAMSLSTLKSSPRPSA
jgi:hypothetical protein